MKLTIADKLSLPLDFVTERIAFLARTGAGKSGGMRVLAEEMLEAGQFVVHLDLRAGDAWGIRASGLGPGYPVLVMGGEHGDVPLLPGAGNIVAEFLVRERISTVVDISDFTKADATRFVTAFANRFYAVNRDVVHLFIDEVDVVAGEQYFDPHCLEAIQYLQTKGRKRGIGVTVSTQRTAIVNKTVLSQAGTLIAMQATAPRDLKAVREYLEYVAEKGIVNQIIGALPTLKQREAFVYSPQFLGSEPQRIVFKSFRTFDSMRTPRPGEVRRKPKKLADIDLSAVQRDMAETIERAKAEDPRELRAEIARLKLQIKQPEQVVKHETKEVRVEVPVVKDSQIARVEKLIERVESAAKELAAALGTAKRSVPQSAVQRPLVQRREAVPVHVHRNGGQRGGVDVSLTRNLRKCLEAFLWYGLLGVGEPTDEQLCYRLGYSPNSSTISVILSQLRRGGYVDGRRITDLGRSEVPTPNVGTLAEFHSQIRDFLDSTARYAFDSALAAHPRELSEEDFCKQNHWSQTSSTLSVGLSALRRAGLMERRSRRLTEAVFPSSL